MRFTINLATKTYINHRLVNICFAATSIILMLMLTWSGKNLLTGLGEIDRLKADITKYEEQLGTRPAGASESDYAHVKADIRFYNGVINRKTANWIGLLDKLEKITPEGIALTSFTPDPKSKEIRIEGEAKSFEKVRSYLERLEESKLFHSVMLQSHQAAASGDKNKSLKFVISFQAVLP